VPPASPVPHLLLLAATVLGLGACGPSGHGKVAQIGDRNGKPVPDQQQPGTDVRLLEAGIAPRAPLRYRLEPGKSESLVLELATELKLAIGDMSPPPVRTPAVRVTIEVRAEAVAPRLTLAGNLVAIEVPDDAVLGPSVIAAVRSDLDRLKGTSWKAVFTDRGHLELLALPAPADANSQLVSTLDRIREALRLLLPPLPDEPVGKDARWQVRRHATVGPAQVDETAIYKLGRDEGRTKLQVIVGMDAREQPLTMPGTPPGATLTLSAFEGGGKGLVDLDLARVVQPFTLRWSALGRGTAQPAGEPPAPITLNLDSTVSVKRR
jgi:hypothetical protein